MADIVASSIISTGSSLPEKQLRNEDLVQFPAAFRGLIEQKAGISARRHGVEGEFTSTFAYRAALDCLGKCSFEASRLDAIILATSSPDRLQPATATLVQHMLGASNAFAFDINSVCSGALYSVAMADALISSGRCRNVLVVASEMYSRILNPNDFSTFPYFGDGAGAVLIGARPGGAGIIKSLLRTDGSGHGVIEVPAGGTMLPCPKIENKADAFFKMDGKAVFSFAVEKGSEIILDILRESSVEKSRISRVVTHQANINIIKGISEQTGIDIERFHVSLDRYGNTAAASVLIGLDDDMSSGRIVKGDIVVLAAFGGGLSWAACIAEI